MILTRMRKHVDVLATDLASNPDPETMQAIYGLKRDLVFPRRPAWPLRAMMATLEKEDSAMVQENTRMYLEDV